MSRSKGRSQVPAGDLAGLPGQLIELRELIREAHGAIKDMDRLLAEHRKIAAEGAREARDASAKAAGDELARFNRHLQGEMNHAAAELNVSIARARDHIAVALTPAAVHMTDGQLIVKFEGANFDEEWPLPPAPDGEVRQ